MHDTLKKAEKALAVYERKLGLVEKFKKSEKAVRSIDKIIEKLVKEHSEDKKLTSQLEKIKQEIYRIDKSMVVMPPSIVLSASSISSVVVLPAPFGPRIQIGRAHV